MEPRTLHRALEEGKLLAEHQVLRGERRPALKQQPEEFFEDWAKKDPIQRLERHMLKSGETSEKEIDEMAKEIKAVIDDAVDWADKSPFPDPEDCMRDVYHEG